MPLGAVVPGVAIVQAGVAVVVVTTVTEGVSASIFLYIIPHPHARVKVLLWGRREMNPRPTGSGRSKPLPYRRNPIFVRPPHAAAGGISLAAGKYRAALPHIAFCACKIYHVCASKHFPPPPYGCTFLRFGETDDRWSPLRSLLGFDCRGVHCTSAVPNHGEAVDITNRNAVVYHPP